MTLARGDNKGVMTSRPINPNISRITPTPISAPAAPPAAAGPSLLDQLNQLTTLHQQGALTDNEFTAAKAKLLG